MPTLSRSLIGAIGCVWLAACAPGAAPSGDGSASPHVGPVSPTASETASQGPSASADPLAACTVVELEGEPVEVTIETVSFAFDTRRLEGPRHCQPFVIEFTNHDGPAPMDPGKHDLNIRAGHVLGPLLFDGDLVGQGAIRYEVPGLPAGEHYFYCSVAGHEMSGTLVVAAG